MSDVSNLKADGECEVGNDKPINPQRQLLVGMAVSVAGFALMHLAGRLRQDWAVGDTLTSENNRQTGLPP